MLIIVLCTLCFIRKAISVEMAFLLSVITTVLKRQAQVVYFDHYHI